MNQQKSRGEEMMDGSASILTKNVIQILLKYY